MARTANHSLTGTADQTTPISYMGIVFICVGLGIFVFQDVIIKLFSDTFSVLQLLLLRSSFAPLIVVFLCWNSGRLHVLAPRATGMVILRGTLVFLSYTTYYVALASMPLAETIAIFFIAPLFVVALSKPLLSESVKIEQWLAVFAGFVGTLLMVKPGTEAFQLPAMMVMFAAFFYALSAIVARKIKEPLDGWNLSFYTNLTPVPFCLAGLLIFSIWPNLLPDHPSWNFISLPWVWPNAEQAWWLLLIAIIGAVGHNLIGQAYRVTPVKYVAPFEYSAMVWGVACGFFIWGDFPDLESWVGLSIIVASGMVVAFSAEQEKNSAVKFATRGSSNMRVGRQPK